MYLVYDIPTNHSVCYVKSVKQAESMQKTNKRLGYKLARKKKF